MTSSKPIRILHISDLHIGENRYTPDYLESKEWKNLQILTRLGIDLQIDMLIIAGDLFESNRVDDRTVFLTAEELTRLKVPVMILPGNHDPLMQDSVYSRIPLKELSRNLHIFTDPEGESFTFPELNLSVWGKPITSYGGDLRPLSGVPPRGREQWQIATAHGYYVGSEPHDSWSFQISEDEIVNSGQDYIALGHWGAYKCVYDGDVKAYYCGSAFSGTYTVAIVDCVYGAGIDVRPYSLASDI